MHREDSCPLHVVDVGHECPVCGRQFNKYAQMTWHRKFEHTRPTQIINFVNQAGLFAFGQPGLLTPASEVVFNAAARYNQAQQMDDVYSVPLDE